MKNQLAIIDYGIGGLNLFKKIKENHPEIGITYFSDAGFIPYGKLPKKKLSQRVKLVISHLKNQGVDTIIIACHAASTATFSLNDDKVIDLITYTQNCIPDTNISIGIIGGERTIRSRKYSTYFKKRNLKVFQRIAQPLSILIEKGEINTTIVDNTLVKILSPIKNVDAIILACTHYSVLQQKIQSILHQKSVIIDPVENLYDHLQSRINQFNKSKDTIYTTGDPFLMKKVAKKVYELNISPIKIAL